MRRLLLFLILSNGVVSPRMLHAQFPSYSASGGNGGKPITVNSGPKLSAPVNLQNSSTNTVGLTCTPVNTSGSNVTPCEVGGTYTGSLPASSAHNLAVPMNCPDSSGSGTVQVCNTNPTFTPSGGIGGPNDAIWYTTTTANTGTGLTVNVNSLGAKSVAIPGASGWTTTLTAGIIPANKPIELVYDGTNWDVVQTGVLAAGGGNPTPLNIQGPLTAVTGTGAVTTLYTFSIPGNTISATGCASLIVGFKHTTGSASVQYSWDWNGGHLFSGNLFASTSTAFGSAQLQICNLGATNSQAVWASDEFVGSSAFAPNLASTNADTTTAQTVSFTFNVANTDAVTPEFWVIRPY